MQSTKEWLEVAMKGPKLKMRKFSSEWEMKGYWRIGKERGECRGGRAGREVRGGVLEGDYAMEACRRYLFKEGFW